MSHKSLKFSCTLLRWYNLNTKLSRCGSKENIKWYFKCFLGQSHLETDFCSGLNHSGCSVFCCCDNALGQVSLLGILSECPFLLVFASSLLDCVCKPLDLGRLQKYSFIQSWWKTELWFVMSTLQCQWWWSEEKQWTCVFVELAPECTLNFKLTCSYTLLWHRPENKHCLSSMFPNPGEYISMLEWWLSNKNFKVYSSCSLFPNCYFN